MARKPFKPKLAPPHAVYAHHIPLSHLPLPGASDTPIDLLAVQLWTDFPAGRVAVAISINDRVGARHLLTRAQGLERFGLFAGSIPQRLRVTEAQARDILAGRGQEPISCLSGQCTEGHCQQAGGCTAVLPIGRLYCLCCGRAGTDLPEQTAARHLAVAR